MNREGGGRSSVRGKQADWVIDISMMEIEKVFPHTPSAQMSEREC